MAIKFTCPCGTKLSAKEELAGRRMRCPACSYEQMIPTAAQAQSAAAQQAPPKPAPAIPPPVRPAVFAPTFQVSAVSQPAAPVAVPVARGAPASELAPATQPRPVAVVPVRAEPESTAVDTVRGSDSEPTVVVPLAKPVVDPWIDRSLEQQVTPWPDDETRRRGSDHAVPRFEWVSSFLVLTVAALLCGALVFVQSWKP